ncbi:MAG: acyl-CoA/acyl-ACP dehydrogenase [Candidatus Binatia bacterium]|nr:acyl-CoA/acyl-ACP dehydrogenase [Candidatus Binatia bacterium]
MDFAFTPEHEELRQTVRRFLQDRSDEATVRRLMVTDEGFDRATWQQLAGQLGLTALIVPEQFGGSGLGPVELAIALEEMGRFLFCAPYFSTAVQAVSLLVEAGNDEAKQELLPQIASGEKIVAVALAEAPGIWEPGEVRFKARRTPSGWTLTGEKTAVIDGHIADELLVVAQGDAGLSLFRVRGDADGVQRELLPTLDLTRKLARIRFRKTPAECIAAGDDMQAQIERAFLLGLVALSAEQVGGAQQCLDMSTQHAKTRWQFGRPIGSFQAIKHRCADMLVAVEFAKSAAYHAAFRAAEADVAELPVAARMAKAYCSDAFFQVANDTIQVHGGMGFTWEHSAHLYFKRAKSSALLFGDAVHHRDKLAGLIGL